MKNRRAANPRRPQTTALVIEDPEPTEAKREEKPLGVTADPPSLAHTLTGSWIAGHLTSLDYTVAKDHGYYSWYPDGCSQPSTKLLWTRGQHVLKSVYAAYGGDAAANSPETSMPVNTPGGALIHESRGTQSIGFPD